MLLTPSMGREHYRTHSHRNLPVACGDKKIRPAKESSVADSVIEFNNRNERSPTEFNPCFLPLVSPATGNIKTVPDTRFGTVAFRSTP